LHRTVSVKTSVAFLTAMHGNNIYRIEYLSSVVERDLPALPREWKKIIKMAVERKLTKSPEIFGKPLRQSLKGFRALRVGDYRIVYLIEKQTVLIVIIQHRSVVYKHIENRI